MNERRIIDLFTGLGGFSLAASWNGVQPVAQVEINPHCRNFLTRAWLGAKQFSDVRKFNARPYCGIWAVMGGPPCQPASRAGDQQGDADVRWLWPEAVRVVDEAQPAWFLFENPPGILDVGLDGILADLERLKYEVQPLSIPACAVDSPQDRERIWILGHATSEPAGTGQSQRPEAGKESRLATQSLVVGHRTGEGRKASDAAIPQRGPNSIAKPTQDLALAHAQCQRQGRFNQPSGQTNEGRTADSIGAENEPVADSQTLNRRSFRYDRPRWPWRAVNGDSAWSNFEWLACPDPKRGTVLRRAPTGLYDVAHGLQLDLPKGVCGKLLEALGNSIVPQVAAEIISAMIQAENA